MNFLPATPFSAISSVPSGGLGGVAMNARGTLIAFSLRDQHCVHIYSVVELSADPVVIGTAGIRGSAHGHLDDPAFVCFVHRNGVDTLLICDADNDRIVEVTPIGDFCRAILVEAGGIPCGIAYCGVGDVIAVSLNGADALVLLQYESGAVKPEVIIGSGLGLPGNGEGQLRFPLGVTFTADGRYILVADCGNHRVSKFSTASGAFISHVATNAANEIYLPTDVLQCEDGSIVVAQRRGDGVGSVVCVGENGLRTHRYSSQTIFASGACHVNNSHFR
jgi:hypothetical protein